MAGDDQSGVGARARLWQCNRATLKMSKDNVIFAVRAVDAEGHRSLPVVPVPER